MSLRENTLALIDTVLRSRACRVAVTTTSSSLESESAASNSLALSELADFAAAACSLDNCARRGRAQKPLLPPWGNDVLSPDPAASGALGAAVLVASEPGVAGTIVTVFSSTYLNVNPVPLSNPRSASSGVRSPLTPLVRSTLICSDT